MNFKYYRITCTKTLAKIAELYAAELAHTAHLRAVLETIGASDAMQTPDNRVVAFRFATPPSPEAWKKVRHGHWPKASTSEGKRLHALIHRVKAPKDYQSALSTVGLSNIMVIDDRPAPGRTGARMYRARLAGNHATGVFFAKVPQCPDSPHQPGEGLVECREWEMLKELDS